MSFIAFYCLFALTTALSALYEVFWPVIKEIKNKHPKTMIGENWRTGLFTLFFGAVLFAPAIIVIVLVPSLSEKFRTTLYRSLIKE
jgi:hypothetical protein